VKVVVITGGSSGIGHATAAEFAQRGDTVVIAGRSGEALEKVAAEINAHPVVCDVAKWDDVHRLFDSTISAFGRVDVWINNASVAEWSPIETMSVADIDRIIAVDLLGTIYGVKAVLPHFRERRSGVIINVASALADRAVPLLGIYSTAKAGVKAFTDALRLELKAAKSGIDVVCVLPSSVNTPFYRWGRSHVGVRPHPISVIYPPARVAKAILRAADRPRREVYVGSAGKLLSLGQRLSPRIIDWYLLKRGYIFRQQLTATPDADESNLYASPGETSIEGDFSRSSS